VNVPAQKQRMGQQAGAMAEIEVPAMAPDWTLVRQAMSW
jgi:hypothetical protein